MPKYNVIVQITRSLEVFAKDEETAQNKAVEIVLKWDGAEDCEAVAAEEI
jgi:hypothetical protein